MYQGLCLNLNTNFISNFTDEKLRKNEKSKEIIKSKSQTTEF